MKFKNAGFALVIVLCVSTAMSAQAQTFSVLYTFTGASDGGNPVGGLIRDAEGNIYGTTCCDGAHGAGTVFMLDKAGNETVLYSFTGGQDGDQPYASLIRDAEGNLYGTTFWGASPLSATGALGVGSSLSWIKAVMRRCSIVSPGSGGTAQIRTMVWSGTRTATSTARRYTVVDPAHAPAVVVWFLKSIRLARRLCCIASVEEPMELVR